MSAPSICVGLISDTHGLLRPEAIAALEGSNFIVHAGDIGDAAILARLAQMAPVTAVRGNNDIGPWADALPQAGVLEAGAARIYVIHDITGVAADPSGARFHAVVSGHSHRPRIETRAGVLYVNPGSAGPRRFSLPVSVGSLVISGAMIEPHLLALDIAPAARG